ncbi:hypothetical protein TcWFU_008614 [Taenia crassiceps]|uniref:Uncharacterized protein n=1 Tax=Taenia crassiceps TaxID=6207 RepID=A0ABR4QJU8_9CEST
MYKFAIGEECGTKASPSPPLPPSTLSNRSILAAKATADVAALRARSTPRLAAQSAARFWQDGVESIALTGPPSVHAHHHTRTSMTFKFYTGLTKFMRTPVDQKVWAAPFF